VFATVTYRYRPEILVDLVNHGIIPRPTTPPGFVRAFLNEIYRYELRLLRDRLLRREFPKAAYFDKVVEVRNRYRVLAVPIAEWTEH
jgi:hypothetical protein